MEFSGIKFINIDLLGLSQIYLSASKIDSVAEWFNPQCMEYFQPLSVHDFGNNTYTITDGHTRAYVAYKNDVSVLPVFYDNDDMITNQVGQMLYKADLFLYGASEDLTVLFFENEAGDLFLYKENTLLSEEIQDFKGD